MRKIVVEITAEEPTATIYSAAEILDMVFVNEQIDYLIISDTADPQVGKPSEKLKEIEGYLWGDETNFGDLLPGYQRELVVWLVDELKKRQTTVDPQVGRKAETE